MVLKKQQQTDKQTKRKSQIKKTPPYIFKKTLTLAYVKKNM